MLESFLSTNLDKRWWVYPAACISAIYLGFWVLRSADVGAAIVLGVVFASLCLVLVARNREDRKFLVRLFLGALAARCLVTLIIHNVSFMRPLIGDAFTYDAFGNVLCQSWQGLVDSSNPWLIRATDLNKSGWGMLYYVAAIYYIVGQNLLASAFVTASLGASTAIVVYRVVILLFDHPRIARTTAVMVAFSPSMIIWSSYGLKDGLIVFCLSFCAFYTLRLREKFSVKDLAMLFLFLFCLYALRHYVFLVLFVAIAGGMILGAKNFSPTRIFQGAFLIVVIGFAFVYFGAKDVAEKNLDLKKIQSGRVWGAKAANTGFGGDVDITDARAAITFLPLGITYVLLAPFPWMINSLGQVITLPELILWWLSFPLLIKGYWFAVRHRLKETLSVCLFTLGLTLVYALYQTNVGTAYRQRAQLYVFFFIFISVGWELRRSSKLLKRAERERWYAQIRNRYAGNAPA